MTQTHQGLIGLLRSAVTGEPVSLPEGFHPEQAESLIVAQGLTTLAFAGARNCGIGDTDPFLQKLWPRYLRYTIHAERQTEAVKQLFALFEEKNFDYLPMKGIVMRKFYPAPELRVMGDGDILIRMEQYEAIAALMGELGYTLERTGQHEYCWRKKEIVLELHRYIVSPGEGDLFSFFGTGWDRAVREEGHRWRLKAEDSWVFLFAHMAKHYRNTGIGSRHMVDLFVFLRNHPGLDMDAVENAMEALGLGEFHRNILRLLECWFAGKPSDDVTDFITEYIFSGGSFGLPENGARTEVLRAGDGAVRGSRRKALLRKLFPTGKSFENQHPILKKCPPLYPVFWIWRWMEVLCRRPGRIPENLRLAAGVTDEKVLARQRALRYVGLEPVPEKIRKGDK